MTERDQKQIYLNRKLLIEKMLQEVNSKEEYDDLLQEQKEVNNKLKILMKIRCPNCGRKNKVKVLSCGTIVCNNLRCLSLTIPKSEDVRTEVKGGKRKLRKNGT